MSKPVTKLSVLRAVYAAGETVEALRMAAKFPRLGVDAAVITRGWAAYQNPDFYRQLGHDPAALVEAGIDAVRDKYGL